MTGKWSKAQLDAIQTRDRNLLVSAAAGSGKTSVLVERVAALVLEGADIDGMLVVTFTNAAAADMRERVVARLGALAEQNGGDARPRLYKQAALAERADISTIHAFCMGVLRRHFAAVGLDPAFRTGNDAEVSVIKAETLDALFDEKYRAPDEDFLTLLEAFGHRDDASLKTCVLGLYEKLGALPDPDAFKARALSQYAAPDIGGLPVVRRMLDDIRARLAGSHDLLQKAARMCGEAFPRTRDHLGLEAQEVKKLMETAASYENFTAALSSWCVPSLPRELKEPQELRKEALALRDAALDTVKQILREESFLEDAGPALADLELCRRQLSALFGLTEAFDTAFSEAKRARNVIDYADMERMAYSVLQDGAVAEEYRTRYDHIFIDEYQDTSFLQEAILSRICREKNLFAVGDVKQSIYRFRMAQPELFMRRYEEYGRGRGGMRIDLVQNYRSTRAVVETVNAVFAPVMTRGAGGVDYGENESLTGYRADAGACELIIAAGGKAADAEEGEDGAKELSATEREAHIAARELIRLKEDTDYRWRDMVVLMRSVQNTAQVYARVFSKAGIPCYADAAEAHIETVEVELFVNLLRLIDNPLQDLPLLSVLFGPVCGLSAEQLLSVRNASPEAPFYEAARAYAEEKTDETALELAGFFARLERWTFEACMRPVDELIEALFDETGIMDSVSALPGGAVRRKNLEILLVHAQDFSKTGQGLNGFIGFLDYARVAGSKGDSARALGENDDVVRIMTVHKSKGLEFPVVVLSGMGRRFNPRDRAQDVIFHDRLGVGVRAFDPVLRTKRANLVRTAILHAQGKEALGEELRILYVGMTRARDVLIMTGSVANLEKRLLILGQPGDAGVLAAICPLDFVFCALQRHGALNSLKAQPDETLDFLVGHTKLRIRGAGFPATAAAPAGNAAAWQEILRDPPGLDVCARVKAAMDYYRLEPAPQIPAKLPATRLHRSAMAQEQPVVRLKKSVSGPPSRAAEQGTATHIALQHLNLHAVRDAQSVREQLGNMVTLGLLQREAAALVDAYALAAFALGELGVRMAKADTVRREWPFTLQIGAHEAIEGAPSESTVLVQGVMDACFVEDGAWVLIDFKTDRIVEPDPRSAAQKHTDQLNLYARALETLTGLPVKEKWVYLLRADRGVRL